MSTKERPRLVVPVRPSGGVLDELDAEAVGRPAAKAAPADAPAVVPVEQPPVAEPEPATLPADDGPGPRADPEPANHSGPARKPRKQRAPQRASRLPVPQHLSGPSTKPFQLNLPAALHWDLKVGTMQQGVTMADAVASMIELYVHDPQLMERAVRAAGDKGIGEFLRPVITAAVEAREKESR